MAATTQLQRRAAPARPRGRYAGHFRMAAKGDSSEAQPHYGSCLKVWRSPVRNPSGNPRRFPSPSTPGSGKCGRTSTPPDRGVIYPNPSKDRRSGSLPALVNIRRWASSHYCENPSPDPHRSPLAAFRPQRPFSPSCGPPKAGNVRRNRSWVGRNSRSGNAPAALRAGERLGGDEPHP
jgi:hypothetical protein